MSHPDPDAPGTDPVNPHLAVSLVTLGAAPDEARRVAVLVHGRDQDDAVMRDVAARLQLPDVAYVLPVAADRSWYPGRYFDPLATLHPHVDWALAAVDRAVAVSGAEDERIVLAGFSQGACLVAEYVSRAGGRRFAGAAVLTGALLGTPQERSVAAVAPGLAMLVTCSRHDEWIALADALETAQRFRDAGARVTAAELEDRVHHVSDRAVDELRALLGP